MSRNWRVFRQGIFCATFIAHLTNIKTKVEASRVSESKLTLQSQIASRAQKSVSRFARDEDGTIFYFALTMFIVFTAAASMGVDFMRHELYRAELQNSLDRGVLAATAFSQTQNPSEIVEDFVLQSPKWNGSGIDPSVNVNQSPEGQLWFANNVNERSISATASIEFSTYFLRFVGVPTLASTATANATQSRKSVEVAIVLDISASMDQNDSATGEAKILGMRTAAKTFIDNVLTPETADLTSVTLIPFGGSVNAGDFTDYMNINNGELPEWAATHPEPYPVCPEFDLAEFSAANVDQIDFTAPHSISHVFKRYGTFPGQTGEVRWSWCPEADAGIVALSNNATTLKQRIDSMQLYDGTGIDMALKWGLYALSPDAQGAVADMVDDNIVPNAFDGWPNSFEGDGVEKYIVFLTDGGITEQFKVRPELWNGTVEDLEDRDIFQNETERQQTINHIASHVGANGRLADYWSRPNENFFDLPADLSKTYQNIVDGFGGTVRARSSATHNTIVRGAQETVWGKGQAILHVEALCSFMKEQRLDGRPKVRTFTIGFNISGLDETNFTAPASAADVSSRDDEIAFVLDFCATTDGDRYLASSDTLDTAFDQIASTINSLRLTN